MEYLKPQSPIQLGENYIYPLTTSDQVINEDGSRGYTILEKVPKLYYATFLVDNWQGSSSYTQTVSLTPSFGGNNVTALSSIYSPPMTEQTSNETTNEILKNNLALINSGICTLGEGTITVVVFEKPTSDIEVFWLIREGE